MPKPRFAAPISVDDLRVEVQSIGEVLVDGSDLAAALVASSFLDECLRSVLMANFRPGETAESLLRPGRGALGTFAARLDAAYSLHIIEKPELQALRTVGEIRNAFAHSYKNASFDNPKIAALCLQLTYAYEVFVDRGMAGRDRGKVKADLDDFYAKNRNRFTHTCVTLGQTLILAAERIARRPGPSAA